MHRQTEVGLVLFKEVEVWQASSEDLTSFREEVCVFESAVGVDVDDGDVVFHRHGGWVFGVRVLVRAGVMRVPGL